MLLSVVISPHEAKAQNDDLYGGHMGKDTVVNTDSIYFYIGKDEGLTTLANAIRFKRINSIQAWIRADSISGTDACTVVIQGSNKRSRPTETDPSWFTLTNGSLSASGNTPFTLQLEDNLYTPQWIRVAVFDTGGTGSVSVESWITVKQAPPH